MKKQPNKKPTLPLDSAELNAKLKEHSLQGRMMKDYIINGKKVRVISLDELKRFSTRLGKISRFYFIGAILMLATGIHFSQQGSYLLPKIFLGMLVFCILMTLLSFRMGYKVEKVLNMVDKKKFHK